MYGAKTNESKKQKLKSFARDKWNGKKTPAGGK